MFFEIRALPHQLIEELNKQTDVFDVVSVINHGGFIQVICKQKPAIQPLQTSKQAGYVKKTKLETPNE